MFVVLTVVIGIATEDRLPPIAPRPSARSSPPAWSASIEVIHEELVREIDHQFAELTSQFTELVGLTAFATALATATVALAGGHDPGAWGVSMAIVVVLAVILRWAFGGRPPRNELPWVETVIGSASLGLGPTPDELRGRYFQMRLDDHRLTAKVIEARRGLLRSARVIVVVPVVMLVIVAILKEHSVSARPASSATTTATAKNPHDGTTTHP